MLKLGCSGLIYLHVSRNLKTRIYKNKENNILEFNQYMKSDKMSYIIYADIECLIKKINIFLMNIQYQQIEHLIIKKMSIVYIAEKTAFSKNFRILKRRRKKFKWFWRCERVIFTKVQKKLAQDKNHWKARDHCHYTSKYRGAAHSICHLKFNVINEIPAVSHNIGKYKTFSVPIEREMN